MGRIIVIALCLILATEKHYCQAFLPSFSRCNQKYSCEQLDSAEKKTRCFAIMLGEDNDLERYRVLPNCGRPVKRKTNHKKFSKKRSSVVPNNESRVQLPKYKKLSDIVKEQTLKINEIKSEKLKKKEKSRAASYLSSLATQKKIRNAATIMTNGIDKGINVLNAILNTPSEWCNEANVVHALTLSAKCVSHQKQVTYSQKKQCEFRFLLHKILDVIHFMIIENKLTTRQLANVAWAIAKHYKLDPMILPNQEINQNFIFLKKDSILSSSEKFNLLSDDIHGTNGCSEKRVVATVDEIIKRLNDSLSMAIIETDTLSNQMMKEMNIGEISMTCWALSTIYPRSNPAGWKLPPLTAKMGKNSDSIIMNNISKRKDTFTYEKWETVPNFIERDDECSNSIMGDFFDLVAQRLIFHNNEKYSLSQMSWNELSTIAWSYAHVRFNLTNNATTLLSRLAQEAMKRLTSSPMDQGNEPTPRDISEIAWALGISQVSNHVLSDTLDQYISVVSSNYIKKDDDRPLKKWTSADCVQLAVALAHGRLDDQFLLKHIYNEATQFLTEEIVTKNHYQTQTNKYFQSWELSVLLWVQARLYLTKDLGDEFDEFSNYVPKVILSRMEAINESKGGQSKLSRSTKFANIGLHDQEKANICWSLTVLDKVKSPEALSLVNEIFRDASLSCSRGEEVRLEHAHQLWQSLFLLDITDDEIVTKEFISFLRQTWEEEKSRNKVSSSRHRALSQTLDFMRVSHYNEHDEDIDVAIVLKAENKWLHTASKDVQTDFKTRVAVEFDGPAHFTRQRLSAGQSRNMEAPRALGHTVLKYKLLKKQGWTVIRIPFYEFDRIPFWASMERQRYVQRKLKTHENIRFSGVDVSEYKAPVPNKQSRFD